LATDHPAAGNPPAVTMNAIHQGAVMNKDQVKGRIKQAKGKIKGATGVLVGNKKLEVEGKVEKTVGDIQAGYGDLKKDLKVDE